MAPGQILDVRDIPFLDKEHIEGRFLAAMLFFDGDWHAFLPIEGGRKVVRATAWPAEAAYYGIRPDRPSDLATDFLQVITQHANFIEVQRPCAAILDDIQNLAASLYKLKLLHRDRHAGAARLAATEIEFLLTVCRSIFDHLQETMMGWWKSVVLSSPEARKAGLPKSFRKVVLDDERRRTADEIAAKYGLPVHIAACYVEHADMFLKIRQFRDQLIHGGRPMDTIFKGESDFQVQRRLGPFRDLDIWDEAEIEPNEIVPLAPILAQVIHGAFRACEDFARAFAAVIQLPAASAPGMTLYVRGYFNDYLVAALNDAEARRARGRSIVAVVA